MPAEPMISGLMRPTLSRAQSPPVQYMMDRAPEMPMIMSEVWVSMPSEA